MLRVCICRFVNSWNNVGLCFPGDGVHWAVMHWRFGGPCPKTDQQPVLQKQFVWQSIKDERVRNRCRCYCTWILTRVLLTSACTDTASTVILGPSFVSFAALVAGREDEKVVEEEQHQERARGVTLGLVSDTESASENYKNRGGCLTDGQTEDDVQTPSYGEPEGSDPERTDSDATVSGVARWTGLLDWNAHSERCCNGSFLRCSIDFRDPWEGIILFPRVSYIYQKLQ